MRESSTWKLSSVLYTHWVGTEWETDRHRKSMNKINYFKGVYIALNISASWTTCSKLYAPFKTEHINTSEMNTTLVVDFQTIFYTHLGQSHF